MGVEEDHRIAGELGSITRSGLLIDSQSSDEAEGPMMSPRISSSGHEPMNRACSRGAGTILTTGRPCLVTMTASPVRSTSSMIRRQLSRNRPAGMVGIFEDSAGMVPPFPEQWPYKYSHNLLGLVFDGSMRQVRAVAASTSVRSRRSGRGPDGRCDRVRPGTVSRTGPPSTTAGQPPRASATSSSTARPRSSPAGCPTPRRDGFCGSPTADRKRRGRTRDHSSRPRAVVP